MTAFNTNSHSTVTLAQTARQRPQSTTAFISQQSACTATYKEIQWTENPIEWTSITRFNNGMSDHVCRILSNAILLVITENEKCSINCKQWQG